MAVNPFLQAGLLNQSSAQVIDGSLKFDRDKSQYLSRAPGSAGNRRTWTYSCWFKKTNNEISVSSIYNSLTLFFTDNGSGGNWGGITFYNTSGTDGSIIRIAEYTSSYVYSFESNARFRDPNAWMHIVVAVDTTIASPSTDRVKVYINGRQYSDWSSSTYPTENAETNINSTQTLYIGRETSNADYTSGMVTNKYFIDGQALDASYFGFTDPLTNTWRPKKLTTWSNPNGDGVTWSGFLSNQYTLYNDGTSGDGSNGFDYSLSTYAMDWNGIYNSNYSYRLEFIPTTPISFTSQVRVYTVFNPGAPYSNNFYVDTGSGYGSAIPHVQNSWVTVATGPGQLYKLKSTSVQNGTGWNAIQIDGVILVNGANRWGQNGFYLPMDGNSPIGEDKSGNGNNWTPVNFGGSNTIEKATGALPILNTDGGGKVATVGVRTDSNYSNLVLALPLVGSANDVSNQINSGSTTKSITVDGASATSTVSNFYGGSFDFDGTNDDLTWSITGGLGSGDFTIEYWVYQDTLSDYQTHISSTRGNNGFNAGTDASGDFVWYDFSSGGAGARRIEQVGLIAVGRWYHWAFVRSGTTITGYLNGIAQQSFTSSTDYSESAFSLGALDGTGEYTNGKFSDVRIYVGVAKYTKNFIPASTDPDILPDTPSGVSGGSKLTKITDGGVRFTVDDGSTNGDWLSVQDNSLKLYANTGTWTIEAFVYQISTPGWHGIISNRPDGGGGLSINMTNTGNLEYYAGGQINSSNVLPPNRWNHLAMTKSGSSIYCFLNGVLLDTLTAPGSDNGNDQGLWSIGSYYTNGAYTRKCAISNVRIINGTALYTSNFTPPSTTLQSTGSETKLLCCQSNTSVTAATVSAAAISSNGVPQATNFNPFTTDINAVRGQETGYATLNPLFPNPNGGTYSNGNLRISTAAGNGHYRANVGMSTGKWYWETVPVSGATPGIHGIGNDSVLPSQNPGQSTGSFGYYSETGNKQTSGTDAAYGNTYTYGDVIGCAYDSSNGKIYWSKNGVWQGGGDPVSGTNAAFTSVTSTPYYPIFCAGSSSNTVTVDVNFGQNPFKFPPPEGFLPLNAANVRPSTVIARPDQYVGIATYQGSSSVNQTISATGTTLVNGNSNPPTFNPDLIWIVERFTDGAAKWIFDSVRGSNNFLQTNNANAEGIRTFTINNNGVSIPANDGSYNYDSTNHYVACCWKAGGSSNTFNVDGVGYASAAAAGLDGGSITPTGASVGTKQGFSIITYTGNATDGATVAHGLGKNPSFILTKNRDGGSSGAAGGWFSIYHPSLTNKHSYGFTTNDLEDSSWNNHGYINTVSSTTWTLKTGDYGGTDEVNNWWINASGIDYVSYIWAEIPGFSKFGSFIGNNSTDGPFVYTGFRPKWILHRPVATGNNWILFDTARDTYNPASASTRVNNTAVESSYSWGDILSDGFKVRSTDTNPSSGLVIYAAFAEAPEFNLYGAQSNAR